MNAWCGVQECDMKDFGYFFTVTVTGTENAQDHGSFRSDASGIAFGYPR